MRRTISKEEKDFFMAEGFLVLLGLLTPHEIEFYNSLYNDFLENRIDSSGYRSDLSGSTDPSIEKITQIMLPSRMLPGLKEKPLHSRTLKVAKVLFGQDMDLDTGSRCVS
jgi:hypothetical protein